MEQKLLGFRGEPDDVIIAHGGSQVYDRVHITGIALRSLRIVALENAADVLMPFADQRLCSCIAAGIIVSYDVDYIFANNIWVIAVDENDRNAAQGQRMIKLPEYIKS